MAEAAGRGGVPLVLPPTPRHRPTGQRPGDLEIVRADQSFDRGFVLPCGRPRPARYGGEWGGRFLERIYNPHAVSAAPRWTSRALSILGPLVAIDLVIQYIAGLGTNAYAPTAFTSNSDYGWLDVHWDNGYFLGLLCIVLVLVAALSRQGRNIGSALVILAAVLVAGVAGMAFVRTSPNPPSATITMGLAFLVAFGAAISFMIRLMRPRAQPDPGSSPAPS